MQVFFQFLGGFGLSFPQGVWFFCMTLVQFQDEITETEAISGRKKTVGA